MRTPQNVVLEKGGKKISAAGLYGIAEDCDERRRKETII